MEPVTPTLPDDVAAIDRLGAIYKELSSELSKMIIGQQRVVELLSIALFSRGHALLMGVPGLAKTLLVSSVAKTLDLSFNRIQFTPDLMPADITGTDIIQDDSAGGIILDDVRAGNVRGHQVRRELDAVETKVQRFCHGTDQQRLRQARNSHQEGMPAGKQGDAQQLHDALLANDHFAQFRGKLLVNGAEPVNGGYVVGQSGGDGFHIAIS